MEFIEITINTTSIGQELVADILWQYSSYGVAICDTNDVLELINYRRNTFDYLEEHLEHLKTSTLVKGYVDLDFDLSLIETELAELASRACIDLGSLEMVKRVVNGDDWVEVWKKHYKPITIGNIVVTPNWIECKTDLPVVKIDTNTAFGTGEHETTYLCLEALQDYVQGKDFVMDVGTGSGILGIACRKLGAKSVYMTDLDPNAVACAKHNVEINGVDNCEVVECDLLEKGVGRCDLLVANITADILAILAKTINQYLRDGAIVILSGILKEKLEYVEDIYLSLGLKKIKSKITGEWSCLVLEK